MALRVGVKKIISEPYLPEAGVKIVETGKNKREQVQQAMQKRIDDLNEALEGRKYVVD